MVNPYIFLEICTKAYQKQQKAGINPTPLCISAEAQHDAILQESCGYRDVMISSKKEYSEIFLGVRSFIYNAAQYMEKVQSPGQFEGTKFYLPKDLEPEYAKLIREAILSRDLFVSKKMTSLMLDPDFLPNKIELNRLICPSFGISWESKECKELSKDDIIHFINKPLKEDPEFHPYGGTSKKKGIPHENMLQTLITPNLRVFGSGPYDERYRTRLEKIKKKIMEIRKEEEKGSGRLSKENKDKFYIDVWSLRNTYSGNYKHYILDALKKSLYMVADITDIISTGVAYEIGIAIGLKKPFFLFWDATDSKNQFNSQLIQEWHLFLKGQDIRAWNKEKNKKGTTFKNWYYNNIDKHGLELSGKLDCVLKGFLPDEKCKYKDLIKKGISKPYISFQTQNKKAEEILISILSESYKLQPINNSDIPADPVCFKCAAIQASKIQIIDASSREKDKKGDPNLALELGFAYAIHENTVIMVFDAELQSNPVEMFPGKFLGWHKATMEKDLKDNLEDFMSMFGCGGIKE